MYIALVVSVVLVVVGTFAWLVFVLLDSMLERDGRPKRSPMSDDAYIAAVVAAGAAAGLSASCGAGMGCS